MSSDGADEGGSTQDQSQALSQASSGSGKTRKKNAVSFSKEELRTMVQGLVRHRDVLFGSKERKTPTRHKEALWDSIAEQVSAIAIVPRTRAELKKRWQDLKVRTRRKVADHRREAMGTGGGTVPDLKLYPWEEGCLSLLDAATDGISDADHGAPSDPEEPGTSSSTAVLPLQSTRKRRAVDPLPLMGVEAQPAPLVQQAVPAPPAPPQSPLPAPAEPQDELQEADFYAPASPPTLESTVLAAADNVIPPPDATIQLDLSDITPDAAEGQMEMSPHHYSVPDDFNVDVQEEEAEFAGASMCRVILERLTALEAAHQSDRRVDAMEALTHLLEGCEEGRRADMKKVISCLTTLAAAVAGQTEQQRLSSDKLGVSVEKLVNAVSEQTVALRQMQASAVVAALAVTPTTPSASTSATASQCSETPQEPTQSPARGLRRQRGGRRGRK